MPAAILRAPQGRRDTGLWLAAGAVALSLLALALLLGVLVRQAGRALLPAPLVQVQLRGAEPLLGALLDEDSQRLVLRASEWQRRGGAYHGLRRSDIVEISYPADALAVRLRDGRELYLRGTPADLRRGLPAVPPGAPADFSLAAEDIADIVAPNQLGTVERLGLALRRGWAFAGATPRDGGSGLWPALVGTVVLVLLMSVLVMPLGVMVALWLHEYAGRGRAARLLRLAIANLASVPSVIYGLFGLVLFVQQVGGGLDTLLGTTGTGPAWGSGGLLWSALTLALLTLPVVVISTEEGLARVPAGLRQAALALGATRAEMLWRVVLPMARPALLTALILAVARAIGEVAPLLLVGAVKYAPALPLDGEFPYLHLSQPFMHLGHSVYDLALTGNDALRDLGQAHVAALLLLFVVVALNATAIVVRNRLRERSRELPA